MKTNNIDISKLERVINPPDNQNKVEEQMRQKYALLVYKAMLRKRRVKRTLWVVSAAAAILVISLVVIVPKSYQGDYQALYIKAYEPAAIHHVYRGPATDSTLYARALQNYSKQDYSSALKTAEELVKQQPQNPDYLFLLGSAYQAINNADQAKHYYELLIPFGGSYALEANWYLALLNLKEGKIKPCKIQLRSVISSGDPTHLEPAKKLLSEL